MTLIIECTILCIIFTLLILIPLFKNPISYILSYPTTIRKRVEMLPEYKDIIKPVEKANILKKFASIILIGIILAVISYFNGAKKFLSSFINSFIIFNIVNLYDLIVLDIIIFCHSKKLIIKGTEDMIKEYKNPKHHIIGFIKGVGIGALVSLISGGIILLYSIIN